MPQPERKKTNTREDTGSPNHSFPLTSPSSSEMSSSPPRSPSVRSFVRSRSHSNQVAHSTVQASQPSTEVQTARRIPQNINVSRPTTNLSSARSFPLPIHSNPNIPPPTTPFVAPASIQRLQYTPRSRVPRDDNEILPQIVPPISDALPSIQSPRAAVLSPGFVAQPMEPAPEPYVFIPMPSPTPSPEQPDIQPLNTSNTAGVSVPVSRAAPNTVMRDSPRERSRGRGGTRRGSRMGMRRGRGRGRGRGAHTDRGQSRRSGNEDNPSAGWSSVPSSRVSLMLEKDFVHQKVSQGARLFCSAAMERLRVELDVKKLKKTRSNVFVLLCDELVGKCVEWLAEFIVLENSRDKTVTASDVYRYLAVMLFSQCTGFSFSKTIDVLGVLGGRKLNDSMLNFINSNILAYSATERGDDESLVWNSQRDQTVMLGQFERAAFRMTARIFLSPNHTMLSSDHLDDDLMGTRAQDNQVKTISSRKADKEGHTADVLADALFRVVLQMRFRRRHDKLENCVAKVVSNLLEARGDLNRQGITVVADRGYARRHFLNALMDHGLSCFGVMPEFVLKCHPIVGRSYLKIAPYLDNDSEDEEAGTDRDGTIEDDVVYDRPHQFVMEDGPNLGPGVKIAKTTHKPQDRTREELTGTAVRDNGTAKRSKVFRFMYSMESTFADFLYTWVAIPYERSYREFLFTTKDDEGRIVEPDAQTYRSVMEQHLLQCCDILTVGQRCADWFVLRQLRVTATSGSKVVMCCTEVRQALQLEPKPIPFDISEPTELVKSLSKSWFSSARSTEAMMRGTTNENAVLNFLKRQPYTKALFSVGLLSPKDSPWLASSPDAILMLDMSKLEEPFQSQQVVPCTVEIKTSVSSQTVQELVANAIRDLLVMDYFNPDVQKYIPEEHMGQIIHQAITANVSSCFYVAASESQVMYVIVVMFDETIIENATNFIDKIAEEAIGWAHDSGAHVPLDKYGDEVEDILLERVPFWKCVNDFVREKGPFLSIRIFRHSSQTFYSKTRGGVEGNAQTRAVMKCSSSSPKWEQKVVTHTFKTILVNAFVAWRMLSKEDLLQTRDLLGTYKSTVNG